MFKNNSGINIIISLLLFAILFGQPTCYAEANNSIANLFDVPDSYLGLSSLPDLNKADAAFCEHIRKYNFDIDMAKAIFQSQQLYLAEGDESWSFSYLYWFPNLQKYIEFVGNVTGSGDDTIMVEDLFPNKYEIDEVITRMSNLLDRATMTQKWEAENGPFIAWDCFTKYAFFHTYSFLPFDLGFEGTISDYDMEGPWEWGDPCLCPLSYGDAKAKVHQAIFEKYGFALDQLENVIEDVRLLYRNTPDVYRWEFRYWIQVIMDDEIYWTVLCGFSTSVEQKPTGNPIPPFYTYETVDNFTSFYSVNSEYFDFLLKRY